MLNAFYKAVFAPLGVFNRDYEKGKLQASAAAVLATAILGSIIAPIVYFYTNKARYSAGLNIGSMFIGLVVSILTWLTVCTLFFIMSGAYKKGLGFYQIASIWGLSYIPNLLCVLLYSLLSIAPGMNSLSGFASFVICTLFIMLLVWKAIFYFMFMRFVMDTTLREITAITAVSAAVFIALMIIGFKAGIQVPML